MKPQIRVSLGRTFLSSAIFFIVATGPAPFGNAQSDNPQTLQQTNIERAAAEQARRDRITAYLKAFVDDIEVQSRHVLTPPANGNVTTRTLSMNGQAVKPGSVLKSPAEYAVTFTKEKDSCWWFEYNDDAFSVTVKKPVGALSVVDVKAKKPLADGFQVGEILPKLSSGLVGINTVTPFPSLALLRATYGAGSSQRDVKDLVRAKIQNGRLDFVVDNGGLGGDPASRKPKSFYIKYICDGNVNEKTFREREHVSLP